jgi:hypothetical protein
MTTFTRMFLTAFFTWFISFQVIAAPNTVEYTKLEHPVLGNIEIRNDLLTKLSVPELNQILVEHAATQFVEGTSELSSSSIILGQFLRELTSSSRAIQEKILQIDRTTPYEADFISEVAKITDPLAYQVGRILGAILDPVTVVLPIVKGRKLVVIFSN